MPNKYRKIARYMRDRLDAVPVAIGDVAPEAPDEGELWMDTSGVPALKKWDGAQWVAVGNGGGGGSVDWVDILNKPSTFPPSAHGHDWTEITGKPSTYPPSSHGHVKADISDFAHGHAWTEITGKPSTFPPDAHNHAAADIASGVIAPARLGTGTPDGTKFLRDDGAWAAPPGGGGGGSPHLFITPFALGMTWTNMPATDTEGPGIYRVKVDLSLYTQVRWGVRVNTAGAAGADLRVQYSTNESSWANLAAEIDIGSTGTKVTAWEALPAGAQADVFLRLMGKEGNGTADPVFRTIWLEFK